MATSKACASCFLCLALVASGTATHTAITPLQKVVDMLHGVLDKCEAEMQDEQVEFAKFSTWCQDVEADKTRTIKEAEAQIVQLNANIQKATSDAEVLAGEIKGLEGDIAEWTAEAKEATAIRKSENELYEAQHNDFSESIDALKRAIQVLKTRSPDVAQAPLAAGEALLQVRALPGLAAKDRALIESFLEIERSRGSTAPEANAYEFQSRSVVDMLEGLEKKFVDEQRGLEKEELAAKHNHETYMQHTTRNIEAAERSASKKTQLRATALEAAATAKGELEQVSATKASDEKFLEDTRAECQLKTDEYNKNQQVRADELKTIEEAIGVLSSPSVAGHAETYLPGKAKLALAQMRGASDAEVRRSVAAFLQARAREVGSKYLAIAASHTLADPFLKVKKLIKDLIVKLMAEANTEADRHAYCETELGTNKVTREDKAAEVEELTAKVEENTALNATLSTAIAELSDNIAEVRAQQSEATENRNTEMATNAQTVADAKEGQEGVVLAMKILKDFYGSVAEPKPEKDAHWGGDIQGEQPEALLQRGSAPYYGQQADAGGILGMLDVLLSDFARLETQTSDAEEAAAAAHKQYMDESNENAAVMETEMGHKESKRQGVQTLLGELENELEGTQKQLDAAQAYFEDLKASCLDTGLSYEKRVEMREAEIESLKQALKALAGQDFSMPERPSSGPAAPPLPPPAEEK